MRTNMTYRKFIILLVLGLFFAGCSTSTVYNEGSGEGKTTQEDRTAEKEAAKEALENKDKIIESQKTRDPNVFGNAQFDQATKDKDDAYSYMQLAYEAHNAGEYGKAIEYFNKCIDMSPENGEAFNGRALSKYKSGNKSGACSDLQKAIGMGVSSAQQTYDSICQ